MPASVRDSFVEGLKEKCVVVAADKGKDDGKADTKATQEDDYMLPASIVRLILGRYIAPFNQELFINFENYLENNVSAGGHAGGGANKINASASNTKVIQTSDDDSNSAAGIIKKLTLYLILSIFLLFSCTSILMSLYFILLATRDADGNGYGKDYVERVDWLLKIMFSGFYWKGEESDEGQCNSAY
jgi:hypothetical protein